MKEVPRSKKSLQPSRKGKKAWRKNVDLEDLEEELEKQREEERLFGGALSEKPDSALFQFDTEGDENLRSVLPKPKPTQLTSLKILSERSAVPAVFSRPTGATNRKRHISREEKDRLLKVAKRPRKGPFGAIVAGAAASGGVSEAVKASGQYDPWASSPQPESESIPLPIANLPPSHAPLTTSEISTNPRTLISLPAVPLPHAGTSYNPSVAAHTELLHRAHNQEEVRLREGARWKEVGQALKDVVTAQSSSTSVVEGMISDEFEDDVDEDEKVDEILPPKKIPQRKTKTERRKAARVLADRRRLVERAAKRRQLSYLSELNAKRSKWMGISPAPQDLIQKRKKALQEKLQAGIAGQKFGKHRVPESFVDVQLGDELSESLRGMKVEGNLFKDRFLNLQQRAFIEPRLRVLPKRRRVRTVEYEKHAWKKFDREQESLSK
ncbi:ribosome biogenesis protein Nop53/GLTSCR2 [Lentinula aciculospora]|uniref:Ribosome biogenesis protein NOP53 n=1 Tax=Lentinula aciculospora TaxID=153920 RepID=A0A9W9ASJ4_9AGAR|nr:ribosome biogenesis protein Nop53/GLTSCR2 [Lentinula aciculospora]